MSEPDYAAILRANLERVFNERDATKRLSALAELWSADPIMYEPDNTVRGREAISDVAGKLLDQFGPQFEFVPDSTPTGHHGIGTMRWRAGLKSGPIAFTGGDIAEITNGKITRLWVILD